MGSTFLANIPGTYVHDSHDFWGVTSAKSKQQLRSMEKYGKSLPRWDCPHSLGSSQSLALRPPLSVGQCTQRGGGARAARGQSRVCRFLPTGDLGGLDFQSTPVFSLLLVLLETGDTVCSSLLRTGHQQTAEVPAPP